MSYQVLARKWRPGRFEQVVGQAHVLAALTNALQQDRLHHAYLFSGTRGVGKTTLARLFAKGLNCETGVTSEPCGQCSACLEIAEGRFVDLIEVDAASRTKVDDTREILENVQYRPARGRYKVYLIDEVHMLSKASFNALLKTLEEPPEHVKFLLATTDPQKLPITVLSRCLQFNLKALTVEQIGAQIERILQAENIAFDAGASLLLARAAQGSMRDGLSLTDQAIAHGGGQLQLASVEQMLGALDEDSVNRLLQGIIDGEVAPMLEQVDNVLGFGGDAESVLVAMLRRLHEVALAQFSPHALQIASHPESVAALAKALAPEQVQLYYKILLEGRRELAHAPDARAGLEMALLRALAFAPEQSESVFSAKPLGSGQLAGESGVQSASAQAVSQPVDSAPAPQAVVPEQPQTPASPQASVASQTGAQPVASQPQSQPMADVQRQAQAANARQDESLLFAEQQEIMAQAESLTGGASEVNLEHAVMAANAEAEQAHSQPAFESPEQNAPQSQVPAQETSEFGLQGAPASAPVAQPPQAPQQPLSNQASPVPATSVQPPQASSPSPQASDEADLFEDELLQAALANRDQLRASMTQAEGDTPAKKSPASEPKPQPRGPAASAGALQSREPHKSELPNQESHKAESQNQGLQHQQAQHQPISELATLEHPVANPPDSENVSATDLTPAAPAVQPEPVEPAVSGPKSQVSDVNAPSAAIAVEPDPMHKPEAEAVPALETSRLPAQPNQLLQIMSQGPQPDLAWYKSLSMIKVGGRIRQLAINSVADIQGEHLRLQLKPDQKHLAAEKAITALQSALQEWFGQPLNLEVVVGEPQGRETPLMIRRRFHKELLQESQSHMNSDPLIQRLQTELGATLDWDSLKYPEHMLTERV
ncbi:DNA polymerase III subunit gamma/tau [Paraferrimonas sedimenticola]|uniref:DNA-directed DNA polymerase n=1 Tax=Paraferrimonas sedimenticola TaxID=375674 RepID=A0AA37RWD5_9GAMM|nr:DNA polymerase III subunit gamma/tau [Paraferrimonas sedimenticola]GLP96905.1 hypothetical protein GCM10007895_22110 [Paraferrimonas sedimenticola]